MKTRQQAADGFYRHLREWFTAFLPRQRGAAQNTITSCRQTWNMLLGYVAEHHHIGVEKLTFTMVDRATVTEFLEHMRATKSWTPSTYNQRVLARVPSSPRQRCPRCPAGCGSSPGRQPTWASAARKRYSTRALSAST
jgi:hypothetical protein